MIRPRTSSSSSSTRARGCAPRVAGYRALDPINQSGEIGYWLRADFGGRGITTACCRALVAHGFERLGFHFEGVLRQSEWLYDRFVDREIYSLLRSAR